MKRALDIQRIKRLALGAGGFATGAMLVSLLANFCTGVLTARFLGDDGRGELAAVQTVVTFTTFLLSFGVFQATAYARASGSAASEELLGSMLLPAIGLGVFTVMALQAVVPLALSKQQPHVVTLARLYALPVVLAPLTELLTGIVMGEQRLRLGVAFRTWPPVGLAIAYGLLAAIHRLTVGAALAANVLVNLILFGTLVVLVARRYRPAPFSRALVRRTFSYGARSHVASFASTVNARLDLFLLPSVLGPAQIGHYALATNLSAAAGQLPSALGPLILPVVARDQANATRRIRTFALGVFGLGAIAVIPLVILAPYLVPLVYGAEFRPSVAPLRVLALSVVLNCLGGVFGNGLMAIGRPLAPSLGQVAGMVVTLIGLAIVLRGGAQLVPVALVSLAASAVIMLTNLALYVRYTRNTTRTLDQSELSPAPLRTQEAD